MSFDIAPFDNLNRDTNAKILGYMGPREIRALLNANSPFRNNTTVALPAQERLWVAARALNVEDVMSALSEGSSRQQD